MGVTSAPQPRIGFVETISVFDRQPAEFGWGDETIIFYNDSDRFTYRSPADRVDIRSGIICFPNNFEYGPGRRLREGFLRITCLATSSGCCGGSMTCKVLPPSIASRISIGVSVADGITLPIFTPWRAASMPRHSIAPRRPNLVAE